MDMPALLHSLRLGVSWLALALLLPLLPGLADPARAGDDDALDRKKAALLLKVQINRAIKTGARWVAERQRPDGSFRLSKSSPKGPFPRSKHRFGIAALCFYNLADCGYGLERACVIVGKRFLDEHDWYAEGARLLVDAQKNHGCWKPGGQLGRFGAGPGGASSFQTDLLDTCFALLFLKRATIVPKQPILEDPVTTPSAK